MKVVKIRGRNRIDVKKRVLDYYFCNRDHLGESLKEFFKHYLIHLSVRDGGDKLAVAGLLLALARMVKHVEEQDDHQAYDQPEC